MCVVVFVYGLMLTTVWDSSEDWSLRMGERAQGAFGIGRLTGCAGCWNDQDTQIR